MKYTKAQCLKAIALLTDEELMYEDKDMEWEELAKLLGAMLNEKLNQVDSLSSSLNYSQNTLSSSSGWNESNGWGYQGQTSWPETDGYQRG